jgi:hypothetical protein
MVCAPNVDLASPARLFGCAGFGQVGRNFEGLPRVAPAGAGSGQQAQWLLSRLIPHRHRPRAELQPAHEIQIDVLR